MKKAEIAGVRPLTSSEVSAALCADDLSFSGLERAINFSVEYFMRLPGDKVFLFGAEKYSPEQMISSLLLFRDTVRNYSGYELRRMLGAKFNFYESVNQDGGAFFTGYYEPVVNGSLVPGGGFTEPVYAVPRDMVEADLGLFSKKWMNEKISGRVVDGRLVPYDSRSHIVYERSLHGRADVLAYMNETDLFFLQIQGSGIIRLNSGEEIRVNYAAKNGWPYFAIGRLLREEIPGDEMSLQAIRKYLSENPERVKDILSRNESYVFFRIADDGPYGNIAVPLTAGRSIAMDKRTTPRGGLALIRTVIPDYDNGVLRGTGELCRFTLVQDTGGAIRGHGRADIFFGRGEDAELTAGHLKSEGRIFLIVAKKEFIGGDN